MMLLADVGNSRIKWVIHTDGQGLVRGQIDHGGMAWADIAQQQWNDLPRPTRVLIVSVAGTAARTALTEWVWQAWGVEAEFVFSTAQECGVRNAYAQPERLGADRWVAMIAARDLTHQPCYVVDCGTALTIDALAADGQHRGGLIIPGIRLMRQALYRETRQIPPEEGEPNLFGNSTRDAVWGGAIYAVAATIDGVTERMMAVGGHGIRFLTGGGAEVILPYLQGSFRLEPDLIFHGLRVIAEQGHPSPVSKLNDAG